MPAHVLIDTEIGPRILRRLQARHPHLTGRYVASLLGISTGLFSKILNGQSPLEIGMLWAIVDDCDDPEAAFGPELANRGRDIARADDDEVTLDDAFAEFPVPLSQVLAGVLESVSPGGDGGAAITNDELQRLLPLLPQLKSLAGVVEREAARRGVFPIPNLKEA